MNIVTDVILPLALAFIMFVLGLNLTGADFLRVLKQPRDFFVGAISQIILLPVIAFILIICVGLLVILPLKIIFSEDRIDYNFTT